jgi:hypothetical protein
MATDNRLCVQERIILQAPSFAHDRHWELSDFEQRVSQTD